MIVGKKTAPDSKMRFQEPLPPACGNSHHQRRGQGGESSIQGGQAMICSVRTLGISGISGSAVTA